MSPGDRVKVNAPGAITDGFVGTVANVLPTAHYKYEVRLDGGGVWYFREGELVANP